MKRLNRVQHRLGQAKYFLAVMRSMRRPATQPEFDWVLEACITSARTVSWLIRAECHNSPLLDKWQKTYKRDAESATLLKKLNDIRIRITKYAPERTKQALTTKGAQTPELLAYLKAAETAGEPNPPMVIDGPYAGPVKVSAPDGTLLAELAVEKTYQTLDEFPNEDVIALCDRYITLLETEYREWVTFYRANQPKQVIDRRGIPPGGPATK